MKTCPVRRAVRVSLLLPLLAIGGCASMGFGYGVTVDAAGVGEIDPYTLQPFGADAYGTDPYGYGMGLDAFGYPDADWYSGWGYPGYPGYLVGVPLIGAAGVYPYAAPAAGGPSHPARTIHPHPGPSPRLRDR